MKLLFPFLLLVLLALEGCKKDDEDFTRQGYRPIYTQDSPEDIRVLAPQEVVRPRKLYRHEQYLLVNEIGLGIHVFDNQNPEAPEAIAFIRIPGNKDMAVRNGVLYADHMGDLVAFNIDDFAALSTTSTLTFTKLTDYYDIYSSLPPPKGSYMECIDPNRGYVVGWESATLINPACHASN